MPICKVVVVTTWFELIMRHFGAVPGAPHRVDTCNDYLGKTFFFSSTLLGWISNENLTMIFRLQDIHLFNESKVPSAPHNINPALVTNDNGPVRQPNEKSFDNNSAIITGN